MGAMTAEQLRQVWVDFWTERAHAVVPSASLIPTHPTAPLFTNSGMMQFVPYFLQEEPAPWPRAESIQKCVRLSGKHNDIDELGRTRRHLTFFEMLGNWSFGDYFKEEAIRWAWELLTERIGFDGDRLWATVHVTDGDAEAIWHETIGLPLDRIQRLDKDNFWEMGATGPCGPCSEIHFDCGPEWGDAGGPAHGGSDRYVEFWNLVFMSLFRHDDGSLTDLPDNNVDTGGGLERFLMLLEGVPTVFDTSVLRPLIEVVESASGKRYGDDDGDDVAMRVIADHARSMAFLVSDGIPPSNEERGYVVRSVVRRAVTRGQQLGIEGVFLPRLVTATVDLMGAAYPELRSGADGVVATIEREEERFRQTLKAGSAMLDDELARGVVSGEAAFRLHDTYGFPVEVTREIAADRGVPVDLEGFEAAMAEQRRRAKDARREVDVDEESIAAYRRIVDEHGPTEFTGREENETKATVVAVLPGADVDTVEVILDRTPFYAEAGGQVGDTGTITTATGQAEVVDTTYALPELHRHVARIVDGEILAGQEALATIDAERRDAIRRNHTGTHVLHWALRRVLGEHVKQQGSLVAPDYLRFDFSHYEPLTPEQLAEIEELANHEVLANDPVRHYETTRDHAADVGAIAFFGDKYGEVVRVLEAGRHSVELCGGTHVRALGDIGPIRILSEGSIGANMRRIFATTGVGTLERSRQEREALAEASELLGVPPDEVVDGVRRRLEETKALRDEVRALRRQVAGSAAETLAEGAVDGVVVARRDGMARDELRDLAVAVRDRPEVRAVVLGGAPEGGGAALVAAVTPDSGLVASELIAEAARLVKGGGGKAADLAMAGGKDPSKLDEALDLARARAGSA